MSSVPASTETSTADHPHMYVTKRSGAKEPVDVNKIVHAVSRVSDGLNGVDPMRIALKTIGGLYDGATTQELDQLSIRTAAALTAEEPEYSQLAARLLSAYIEKEVTNQDIYSFSQSINLAYEQGIVNDRIKAFVDTHARKLNDAVKNNNDRYYEYFGLKTVYDRYLLRHPTARLVIETPQYFFMRVACALGNNDIFESLELYRLFSKLDYMSSSPTLFNAGCVHEQMSSCYLLDSPDDSLEGIYGKYADVAKLSKFAGGIGVSWSRIRATGSHIKGTNGHSNGIVPWLKTLDASVSAVNQGGKRKGAACVYLETWHADIESFLELRDNTGDHERRTHNLNLANWIPDLFMKRVDENGDWSLFDPKETPELVDTYGQTFEALYLQYEVAGLAKKTVKARDLYARMMRTLAQTGNGWMNFKDRANATSNQTAVEGNTIHLSNLCVAPETMVLTDRGHFPIVSLAGQKVNVWNGEEFSEVEVKKTGENQELVAVSLSDGRFLECTPYHKFYVQEGYNTAPVEKRAAELNPGDKLIKSEFPVIEGDCVMDRPYLHGFYTGDGTVLSNGQVRIYLDGEKRALADKFEETLNWREGANGRLKAETRRSYGKFFVPDASYTIQSRLAWLAGWLDAGGTVHRNSANEAILASSVDSGFMQAVQYMLQTLGVSAKINHQTDMHFREDDGGGMSLSYAETVYHLIITTGDTQRLLELGLKTHRLSVQRREPQRNADQFAMVVDVYERGRIDDTYCFTEPKRHMGVFNGILTGNCTEILEVTNDSETAVCNLGSINLAHHTRVNGAGKTVVDYEKISRTVKAAIRQLNRVIDINYYPIATAADSNAKWRPVGLGLMGLQDVFFQMGLPFDSDEAKDVSAAISEHVYFHALKQSVELAKEFGPHAGFKETRAAYGELQFDYWPKAKLSIAKSDWETLREEIKLYGLRNSLMIAIAPTATIASIVGAYECIEPQVSNLFKRETLSGDFLVINRYLADDLKKLGLWTPEVRDQIKAAEGSIQGIEAIPEDLKAIYRTAWELPQKALIDHAAARGAFIDQSQSLNLFMENPNIGQLSSMYMYAWKSGIKTTYYLRSRPATKIAKTTLMQASKHVPTDQAKAIPYNPAATYAVAPTSIAESVLLNDQEQAVAAVFCSLENPEACESCQ